MLCDCLGNLIKVDFIRICNRCALVIPEIKYQQLLHEHTEKLKIEEAEEIIKKE